MFVLLIYNIRFKPTFTVAILFLSHNFLWKKFQIKKVEVEEKGDLIVEFSDMIDKLDLDFWCTNNKH